MYPYVVGFIPVVIYACETWVLTQKDKLYLRIFERKILRTIFELVQDY